MTDKSLFKQLIADFHSLPIRPLIERDVKLPLQLEKIVVVTGMRRSGKTSLLLNAIRQLREHIAIERLLYLNFEDERLDLDAADLDSILQAYRELYPNLNLNQCYFFFDEIQEIKGWETFVRRLDDSISRHIFITGSNAKLLSSEIATALRGRCLRYEVFPLSFAEYLRFRQIEQDVISSQGLAKLAAAFDDYLLRGGFPELVTMREEDIRRKVLQDYYDVMLFRDIVERYQESNLPALKYFLKRLLESVSSPLSIAKIHNEMKTAGFKVGKNTLHDYLAMSEAVYFVLIGHKYDPSIVRQTMAERKTYVIDNGFLTSLSFRYSKDSGKLLENLVAIDIRRRGLELQFIKGTKECDFVIAQNQDLIPIQVSADISHPDTLSRELAGLVSAAQFLQVKSGLILTHHQTQNYRQDGIDIKVRPVWQFLLDQNDVSLNSSSP